jgi:hypothetical protein
MDDPRYLLPPSACNALIDLHLRQYLALEPGSVHYTRSYVLVKRPILDTFLKASAAHLAHCLVPEGLVHQKSHFKQWLEQQHGTSIYSDSRKFPGGNSAAFRFPLDGTEGISSVAAAVELLVQQLQLPVTYQVINNQQVEALPPGCEYTSCSLSLPLSSVGQPARALSLMLTRRALAWCRHHRQKEARSHQPAAAV